MNDFKAVLDRIKEKGSAANSGEVVVDCKKHGSFTKDYFASSGLYGYNCPGCSFENWCILQSRKAREWFRSKSGVPARFLNCSFENYISGCKKSEQALETVANYARDFRKYDDLGTSLILCGSTGAGKTHLACSILREVIEGQLRTGYYTTAYSAVQDVRRSYGNKEISESDILKKYIETDLLVIDEVGVQYGTESENLILFSILNGRYEAIKPTVVISNLNLDGIKKYLDARLFDRLRESRGGVLSFSWESHRGSKKGQVMRKRSEAKIARKNTAEELEDFQDKVKKGIFREYKRGGRAYDVPSFPGWGTVELTRLDCYPFPETK